MSKVTLRYSLIPLGDGRYDFAVESQTINFPTPTAAKRFIEQFTEGYQQSWYPHAYQSNTDSGELLEAFRNDFNHIGDGRILVEPQELADYILAYGANMQLEELHAVNQNQFSPKHKFGRISWPTYYKNRVAALQQQLKNKIDRYTANKQRQLLEWVEQNLPIRKGGAAMGRNYWSGVAKGNNDVLDEIEQTLKNKKESLS